MTQAVSIMPPTPEPVTIDPVQIDPVDPKAARAASLQDAPSLKDAFLKAVAEEFDARLAAAQADDTLPVPDIATLDATAAYVKIVPPTPPDFITTRTAIDNLESAARNAIAQMRADLDAGKVPDLTLLKVGGK